MDVHPIALDPSLVARCPWQWDSDRATQPLEYVGVSPHDSEDSPVNRLMQQLQHVGATGTTVRPVHALLFEGYHYWVAYAGDQPLRICRQKLFAEFDTLPTIPDYHYTSAEFDAVAAYIMRTFPLPIFEAGCGDGLFIARTHIAPDAYVGVDPSQQMIAHCQRHYPAYSTYCCAFEESSHRWLGQPYTIIATFGAASYLLRPYLQQLSRHNSRYFLMFYEHRYCPDAFIHFHHFDYTDADLRILFPTATLRRWGHYRIVESGDSL